MLILSFILGFFRFKRKNDLLFDTFPTKKVLFSYLSARSAADFELVLKFKPFWRCFLLIYLNCTIFSVF